MKISNNIELNATTNQQDIIHIYRILHLTTVEHTFFSSAYKTLITINHILNHQTNLTFLKIEIIHCMFFDRMESHYTPITER